MKFCFSLQRKKRTKEQLLYDYVYQKNHKKVLKLLKKGVNPNTVVGYNVPMDLAIHNQDLKMIKILIYHGALLQEEDKMFCYDCRRNHDYIYTMYDCYRKLVVMSVDQITLKYKIPPGLDIYLKSFLREN